MFFQYVYIYEMDILFLLKLNTFYQKFEFSRPEYPFRKYIHIEKKS